jgi:hypothetical protein
MRKPHAELIREALIARGYDEIDHIEYEAFDGWHVSFFNPAKQGLIVGPNANAVLAEIAELPALEVPTSVTE